LWTAGAEPEFLVVVEGCLPVCGDREAGEGALFSRVAHLGRGLVGGGEVADGGGAEAPKRAGRRGPLRRLLADLPPSQRRRSLVLLFAGVLITKGTTRPQGTQ